MCPIMMEYPLGNISFSIFRVDVFDNDGRSALHLAAECGSMEVNLFFLILCFSKQFKTFPMHCNYGKVFKLSSNNSEPFQVCKLLLDKNAFVNSKTKLGWTALHFAASKVTICFLLL